MSGIPELYSFEEVEEIVGLGMRPEDVLTEEQTLRMVLNLTPTQLVDELMGAQKFLLSLTAYALHLKEAEDE